jgi:predicted O-linked N-acetylglucosamine transferase (SPINDLY family)
MDSKEIERAWAALQRGDAATSAGLFAQICNRSPDNAEAHAGLGHVLLRQGREDPALASLQRARDLAPQLPQVARDLALIAMRRSDFAGAERSVRHAVTLQPNDANAWFLLAQALFALVRFDEAEDAFTQAAALHPSFIDARFQLGNMAFDRKAYAAASRHYRAFVGARAGDLNGWINLGLSLASGGDLANARAALENAVALAPDQIKPVALLASVLKQSDAAAHELVPVLKRVLELSPESVDMRVQLACSLFDELDYREAHTNLARALELDPDNLTARWLKLQMPHAVVAPDGAERDAFLARWRSGIAWFEALDWNDPRFTAQAADAVTSAANFYLAYLGHALVGEQVRNATVLRAMAQTAYPQHADAPVRPIGTKRRRIAVCSSSLNAHSVSRVWSPALLALDPAEFELAAFYPGTVEDISTQRWRARVEVFEAGMRPVASWIDALRAWAPDIVIFPDIGMDRFVQAVASLRHAPVQVTTWGHPVTSGMATIDYFLSADACEADDADAHYSERLVRLPRLGTFLDLPDPVAANAANGADDRPVRLLCSQSADKLHPGHDALFATILQRCPAARLDILCSMRTNVADALAARMRAAFTAAGVEFDSRCCVHPRLPLEDYYRFIAQADLCLDSLDFSGCVTSLDALWRDKPIVTLPGTLMRGRQTSGMLRRLGLDELIAGDSAGYVRIATRLANDPVLRARIGERIRAAKSSLYRDQEVVVALAQFLRTVEAPPERTTRSDSAG